MLASPSGNRPRTVHTVATFCGTVDDVDAAAAPTSPSLWHDQTAGDTVSRPALAGERDVDVVIVGAGYSGLWTAYSLVVADPAVRVLVVERDTVGFGASGRNGGWCVGELAGGLDGAISTYGRGPGVALTRAAIATVDEVGRVVAAEGIECGFAKGGVIRVAGTEVQAANQRHEVTNFEAAGIADELTLLDATAARLRLNASSVHGGLWYRPAARVHPARLVHGLARAVERRGVEIVEHTAATAIVPGSGGARDGRPQTRPAVRTDHGTVTADVVVRATEAYTRDLPGERRSLVPLYSLMIATEPLPPAVWDEIGLRDRETFSDDRRMVIYGQRTTDDRIAFGGRGARYRFASRIEPAVEQRSGDHDRVEATLRELLPMIGAAAVTHRWGGVLGVPRDWRASVGFDRPAGVAWAGGYVGEGVAASNLAGRTLADLILGRPSELTALAWVDRRSRRWEPEPLRWLGINGSIAAMSHADRVEARTGRRSRVGSMVEHLIR
jgi:glycine/D-amino acid oxidase-like deaminating enzyme